MLPLPKFNGKLEVYKKRKTAGYRSNELQTTSQRSGLILTGQSAVGMPQHATGSELDVITAVLLGGTSLAGGKGSILGTLAGVLILGVLYNGFTMIGFRYVHIRVFQGIILILVVSLYEVREKKTY